MTDSTIEATAEERDAVAFDRQHQLVKAALTRRATFRAYFEVRTETKFHGLWLCGRGGEDTEMSLCSRHDTVWILLDYYENWTLIDQGAAVGHCGPYAINEGVCTDVTARVCLKHGRRRRDPYHS